MIKLGQHVRDLMCGLEGIAAQYVDMLNGNRMIAVQPRAKDPDKLPEAVNVDEDLLEVLDDGIMRMAKEPQPCQFKLGEEAIDQPTGVRGTLVKRYTFLNGCIYYGLVQRDDSNRILPSSEGLFVPQERLRTVPASFQREEASYPQTKTGGPYETSVRP